MTNKMKKLAVLCLIAAVFCAAAFPAGVISVQAEAEWVYHDILSVIKVIGDKDILITFNDEGTTRYGVFHQDDSITPLYLMQRYAMEDRFFPNSSVQLPYEFGILPNGDYYEQMTHDNLQEGAFRIMSREGELLYESDSAEAAECIVGYTGDKIAVLRYVTGFLDSTWILKTIDHHGRAAGKEHDVGEWGIGIFNGGMQDLGFGYLGIAKAGNEDWNPHSFRGVFLDTNEDQCYITDPWQKIRPFEADTQISLWEHSVGGWSMDTEYNSVSFGAVSGKKTPSAGVWVNGVRNRTIAEGLYFDGESTFYDYSGKKAFQLPDYGSKVDILYVGKCQDGYVPLVMRGADKNSYITMLNREGEVQYAPVRLRDRSYSTESDISEAAWYSSTYALNYELFINNGYAFYESDTGLNLVTPAGEELAFQRPNSDMFYYGVANGYVVFQKTLLRLTDPSRYITQGYTLRNVSSDDEWEEQDWEWERGVDYSDVWARTWTRMDEPETQIVITSLGNGLLHADMTFFRMTAIEAEMEAFDYEFLWFENSEQGIQGELRIEPAGDGLLHAYIYTEEDSDFHDYFNDTEFIFTSEELPDLTEYGWEPFEYPEPSEWTGHWNASAEGHQIDAYIAGYGQGFDFGIQIIFDGTLSCSAFGGSIDPWTEEFYADELNCILCLDTAERTLTMYDAGSTVDEINDILDLLHFEAEFTWVDAAVHPG